MAQYPIGVTRSASFVLAVLTASLVADSVRGQTVTYVPNDFGNWIDSDFWLNAPAPGYPNAAGVDVVLPQPIGSTANAGTYTLSLNSTDITLGSLTSNNDPTGARFFVTQIQNGKLIFDSGSPGVSAKLNENGIAVTTSNATRMRIVATVQLNSDLEVNSNHALDKNTNTEIFGRIDGAADKTITKKGYGNLQLDFGAPAVGVTEGFFGNLVIENGAVRLIVLNNGSEGTVNNVLSKSAGVTVVSGGQLQFGNILNSVTLGPGAELKLNGIGKAAPANAKNDGALRFADALTTNCTFQSPINLQSDSRINVDAATNTGTLAQEVRGVGQLQKSGPGTVALNFANTYSGGTAVMEGALKVDGASATLGTGNVTVSSVAGASLRIETGVTNAIANSAALSLGGGGSAGADQGYAFLGAGVNETIGGLILGGTTITTPGTYGATGSGATNLFDDFFAGTGMVTLSSSFLAADFNNSGSVDGVDLGLWKNGFGPTTGQTKINGDANSDGAVDGADFLVWQRQVGLGSPISAIPEPTAAFLTFLAAPLAAMIRRKRHGV